MRLHYHFDVPEDKKVRVVVDTDAKNEADDQFAIVQAILTPKFRLEGIVAAHYKEGFAAQYGGAPVKDSMMQSYAEVEKILDLMNVKNEIPHFKGCKVPVGEGWEEAEGVDFIIDRAMAEDSILHLIVLGPLTNVAAALKKEFMLYGLAEALILMERMNLTSATTLKLQIFYLPLRFQFGKLQHKRIKMSGLDWLSLKIKFALAGKLESISAIR